MQQNRQTNAKAIASLVLSCASMICCMQWSISLVMAVLAIVVAVLLIKITNNSSMQHLEQTASFFAPYGRI